MGDMKKKEFTIEERVGGSPVEKNLYVDGLLDVIDYLYLELKQFLTKEGRCFGIIKSYLHSVQDAYTKIFKDVDDEKIEVYGRVLYLYKPLLRKEFTRLVERSLSPADAVIVIIRKLLSIVDEVQEYEHRREVKTIKKVTEKMYDNIRNHAKKDSLFLLANTVKTYMDQGKAGRYRHDIFKFEVPEKKNEKLENPGDRLKGGGAKKKEVSL